MLKKIIFKIKERRTAGNGLVVKAPVLGIGKRVFNSHFPEKFFKI